MMNYTDGSPCGDSHSKRSIIPDDDEDDEDKGRGEEKSSGRRKNTIISFLCDQEIYDSTRPKVTVSFVSSSPDECTYVFEARSHLSCGGLATPPQAVGAGGVFGLM